jgi:hypothetical protein
MPPPSWVGLPVCFYCFHVSLNSSTLRMIICYSETSVDFHRTTRCYILEDIIHHSHRCENLKSKKESTRIKNARKKRMGVEGDDKTKQEVLGRTNRLLSFGRTRIA